MGNHKEWRKIAKRERRRRIRTQLAKREEHEICESYRQEQELIEEMILEQIENSNKEENDKWLQAEKIWLQQWKKLQEEKQKLHQKRLEEAAKYKMEYELEQKKREVETERLRELQEKVKRKQEIFMENLDKFLTRDSEEPPPELKVIRETRPNAELCPFFFKTACCRFGDKCSRNHQYPGISRVLLATNFYTHFGLSTSNLNEYDTHIMLEYEDSETYKEYKEFFFDVISEFEKFGKITQFKVCFNQERHLRGNTYVEYADLRCAVAAYRSLHTRWYGGRQLSLQFCLINSWKNAVCGLQIQRRCPKGRSCNFLHIFRNPNNLYPYDNNQDIERSERSTTRSCRWSITPEPERPTRRSSERADRRRRRRRRSRDSNGFRKHRRRSPRRSSRY